MNLGSVRTRLWRTSDLTPACRTLPRPLNSGQIDDLALLKLNPMPSEPELRPSRCPGHCSWTVRAKAQRGAVKINASTSFQASTYLHVVSPILIHQYTAARSDLLGRKSIAIKVCKRIAHIEAVVWEARGLVAKTPRPPRKSKKLEN